MKKFVKSITTISSLEICQEKIRSIFLNSQPSFLGRIGGSDTDTIVKYFSLKKLFGEEKALKIILTEFEIVKRYNGYYDKKKDEYNIVKFCNLFKDLYFNCADLLVVGAPLLSELMPETINPIFRVDTSDLKDAIHSFLSEINGGSEPLRLYPYSYIEQILAGTYTMFRLFSEILLDKTVLIVSPFSKSVKANFENRKSFFPSFQYPDFKLVTYNTPITYDGLPEEFYPDTDWFHTVERMSTEISNIDFDIALLACGSYAMPLGSVIRDKNKKKAIYVGGCLQLFFGITGRRYEDIHFTSQINIDAFIHPVERDYYLPFANVSENTAKEAFGAYF